MLDENSKQNVRNHIKTLCRTALEVIEVMRADEETDLVDRLEKTAGAIAEHYDMEPELMEEYRNMIKGARKRAKLIDGSFRYTDAENAKEMIYALCDDLDNPKEIMCHVRTADEMLTVWKADRD
ncbi:hypothetical protein [Hydrogeniiclostridium mannosilyticum]|uniref:hypothetical protein n=1 Tax=Hydrogeniiclostridium mannosilyticum TaxID=2764322 RepID=UPI00399AFF1E